MTAPGVVVDAQDLRFRWPGAAADTVVLPALRIAAGEQVFLRGASGSGKSTLLSLLAGVLPPQAGTLHVMGKDLATLSGPARDRLRADHLGVIFQQFNLLPWLSAHDNVTLALRFSARRRAQAAEGEAGRLLGAMGLADALWRRPAAQLSVGQQQRVAAARALIGRPALILADEPTSALDEDARDAFMALLLQCCAEAGSALVFVSHDARLAERFARVERLASDGVGGA
ncbi:MAG: ABC transporter ATP-binding protein [Rhodoferax sp.]|nr:ABC transporter ATP-binding protein [Rhodoferax sp.]